MATTPMTGNDFYKTKADTIRRMINALHNVGQELDRLTNYESRHGSPEYAEDLDYELGSVIDQLQVKLADELEAAPALIVE